MTGSALVTPSTVGSRMNTSTDASTTLSERASKALLAEFAAQIHPDGGHEERSPMYHSLILENGLDLQNLAQVAPRTPAGFCDRLGAILRKMVDALALYTGPDGRILLFADSAWGVAAELFVAAVGTRASRRRCSWGRPRTPRRSSFVECVFRRLCSDLAIEDAVTATLGLFR